MLHFPQIQTELEGRDLADLRHIRKFYNAYYYETLRGFDVVFREVATQK